MSCFFSIIDLNIDSFWKMSLCRNLFQALERYDNKEPWGKLLLWNIAWSFVLDSHRTKEKGSILEKISRKEDSTPKTFVLYWEIETKSK
ncbi:hypothetical protein Gasu2_11610 [Galdieria sulphuraria]|nr:hypothetical protein Gasu2_11610 [Galdieria sulphuraria]